MTAMTTIRPPIAPPIAGPTMLLLITDCRPVGGAVVREFPSVLWCLAFVVVDPSVLPCLELVVANSSVL